MDSIPFLCDGRGLMAKPLLARSRSPVASALARGITATTLVAMLGTMPGPLALAASPSPAPSRTPRDSSTNYRQQEAEIPRTTTAPPSLFDAPPAEGFQCQ